jgi:hypothetical protein
MASSCERLEARANNKLATFVQAMSKLQTDNDHQHGEKGANLSRYLLIQDVKSGHSRDT